MPYKHKSTETKTKGGDIMQDPENMSFKDWVDSLVSDEIRRILYDNLDQGRIQEIFFEEYKQGGGKETQTNKKEQFQQRIIEKKKQLVGTKKILLTLQKEILALQEQEVKN